MPQAICYLLCLSSKQAEEMIAFLALYPGPTGNTRHQQNDPLRTPGTLPYPALLTRSTSHCSQCSHALTSCLLQGHDEIVWAVEVTGDRLLSASADKTIRIWDIGSRRCERVLEDHVRPVLSLAVAGNRLFSGSYDYTIKVWCLDSLQRLKTLTGVPGASWGLCECWSWVWWPCWKGSVVWLWGVMARDGGHLHDISSATAALSRMRHHAICHCFSRHPLKDAFVRRAPA